MEFLTFGGEVGALRRRDAAARRPLHYASFERTWDAMLAGWSAGSLPAEYAFRQTSSPAAESGAVV
jgi:hypothetical protein